MRQHRHPSRWSVLDGATRVEQLEQWRLYREPERERMLSHSWVLPWRVGWAPCTVTWDGSSFLPRVLASSPGERGGWTGGPPNVALSAQCFLTLSGEREKCPLGATEAGQERDVEGPWVRSALHTVFSLLLSMRNIWKLQNHQSPSCIPQQQQIRTLRAWGLAPVFEKAFQMVPGAARAVRPGWDAGLAELAIPQTWAREGVMRGRGFLAAVAQELRIPLGDGYRRHATCHLSCHATSSFVL